MATTEDASSFNIFGSEFSLGEGMTCQSCHMPPAAHVGNSVDLGNILDLEPDSVSGWYHQLVRFDNIHL